MYVAYEALPDDLKARLGQLEALHTSDHAFGRNGAYAKSDRPELAGYDDTPEAVHPAVITHPCSGKKALYVNPAFTRKFVGWTREESLKLLDRLYAHAVQPQFVRRHKWRVGDMAIWDNRCTWHFALNDYQGHNRLMHRITLDGVPLHA
jgi:taurine dioxygenase